MTVPNLSPFDQRPVAKPVVAVSPPDQEMRPPTGHAGNKFQAGIDPMKIHNKILQDAQLAKKLKS
jgi:hypothetical protein